MFHPETYWEKRCAALEALVLQICQMANLSGLLGPWYQQTEVMKNFRVEQVLGPVTLPEDQAATGPFIFGVLPAKLMQLGLVSEVHDESVEPDPQQLQIDENKRQSRVLSLPDLEASMGPDINDGLYRISAPGGHTSPVLVLHDGNAINFFIVDEQGMHALSLNLKHLPSTFKWETGKQFWRSELYQYRGDMLRVDFVAHSDLVLNAVDFTELNAEMDAAIARVKEDADKPVEAANDEVVNEISSQKPADWFDSAKNPEDR